MGGGAFIPTALKAELISDEVTPELGPKKVDAWAKTVGHLVSTFFSGVLKTFPRPPCPSKQPLLARLLQYRAPPDFRGLLEPFNFFPLLGFLWYLKSARR